MPSCRTRSYSAGVRLRRSKQPVVAHSQTNSTGISGLSLVARLRMFSFTTLNTVSFLARRSWRSSSTTRSLTSHAPHLNVAFKKLASSQQRSHHFVSKPLSRSGRCFGQQKIHEQSRELRELRETLAIAEVELAHLRSALSRQVKAEAPVEPWRIKEQAARLVASLYSS